MEKVCNNQPFSHEMPETNGPTLERLKGTERLKGQIRSNKVFRQNRILTIAINIQDNGQCDFYCFYVISSKFYNLNQGHR